MVCGLGVVGPAVVVLHVQTEPAELMATLIDGLEQLFGPFGAVLRSNVAVPVEQEAFQVVQLGDGRAEVGLGGRHQGVIHCCRGGFDRRGYGCGGGHRRYAPACSLVWPGSTRVDSVAVVMGFSVLLG